MNNLPNYIVETQCWRYGKVVTECNTEKEACEAIGKRSFGGLYYISSPTGLDTIDFIPF